MFKYKVVDKFITPEECRRLISDFESFTPASSFRWHGGRKLIPNTSDEYKQLLEKSKSWKRLTDRINSSHFIKDIMTYLEIDSNKYIFFPFLYKFSRLFGKFTKRASMPVRNNNVLFLSFWILYSLSIKACIFLVSKFLKIFNRNIGELLFDASSARNGYSREIHRDSDSRVFVFLLYLNSPLDNNCQGGDLLIHKLIEPDKDPKPQPLENECTISEVISPRAGRLVVFENNRYSFHSVSKMINHSDERFFCYGSFTLPYGKASNFSESKYKLPTDIKMYL